MILSPHVLGTGDGRHYVAVIRHPPGEKPSAARKNHTVVALIRPLPTGWRLTEEAFRQGQAEAEQWIAAHQDAIDRLPAAPGYGLADRQRRFKEKFKPSRDRDARVLRGLRRGLPLEDLLEQEPSLDRTVLRRLLTRWSRFAEYKSQMNDLWPHRRMKAFSSAFPTGIVDVVAIARRLAYGGTLDWPDLAAVATPPLGRITVYRHIRLLQDVFEVQVTRVRGQGWRVTDWGLFDPSRLQQSIPLKLDRIEGNP